MTINNVKEMIEHIEALIEVKKEELRACGLKEKLLISEIVELEEAHLRLTIHNIDLIKEMKKERIIVEKRLKSEMPNKQTNFNINEIITWIIQLGHPVTYEQICQHIGKKKVMGLGANLGVAVKKGRIVKLEGGRFAALPEVESV